MLIHETLRFNQCQAKSKSKAKGSVFCLSIGMKKSIPRLYWSHRRSSIHCILAHSTTTRNAVLTSSLEFRLILIQNIRNPGVLLFSWILRCDSCQLSVMEFILYEYLLMFREMFEFPRFFYSSNHRNHKKSQRWLSIGTRFTLTHDFIKT